LYPWFLRVWPVVKFRVQPKSHWLYRRNSPPLEEGARGGEIIQRCSMSSAFPRLNSPKIQSEEPPNSQYPTAATAPRPPPAVPRNNRVAPVKCYLQCGNNPHTHRA